MECRPHCGACCIAPSITSSIPGMPEGKPAGVACVQLDESRRCRIFDDPRRPRVCGALRPAEDLCGDRFEEAMGLIGELERLTSG